MPSQSLPLNVLKEIDRVCESFESAWRAGQQPRIEDFLDAPTILERTELIRELLAREVELRRKAGECLEPADYLERFAAHGDLIQTVLQAPGRSGGTVLLRHSTTEPGPQAIPEDSRGTTAPNTTVTRDRSGDLDHPRGSEEIVVPERIGRFRPSRLLGRGNFLVFLAWDDENGREVAIKVARPDDPFGHRRLMSLAEEAQRLNGLNHPGIVRVHEFVPPAGEGTAGGTAAAGPVADGFIVLEFVDGTTLEQLFRFDRPSPARLAELVAAVGVAVHHAHTAGLVHRDLKPSNVLLDSQGNPHVCDFGLAVDEEVQRLRRGEVAGTLPYMAPEQIRGETNRLDGRTDIWALGVILYRGLTGRLPFRGDSTAEYFEEILHREPRPPRQYGDHIPRELERICLRCLSRPMTGRYLTAADLAEELRTWSSRIGRESQPPPGPPPGVLKGLRSFDDEDAAFFLALLPGARGSDGLPESVRFWKARIEAVEGDKAFSVGLLYGPSGGGKTSFVRAGLLPNLDRERVRSVYLEATPQGTEARLLAELFQAVPSLPCQVDLPDAIAILREAPAIRPREKLLLVLDQFEQWLQGRPVEPEAELVRALRQCDGRRVQALLLVRDDFWMATTRLLRAVEVPLVEGTNAAAVELFDPRHARKVLEQFGRSLGQLPPDEGESGGEASLFLDQAAAKLTGPDGHVIPVRLSLFAEVVRLRPWTRTTLRILGGVEGIEAKFLEEAFEAASAPPAWRVHRTAAEAVLKALLPPPASVIRGRPRSSRFLREAAGYTDRPVDFTELIRVLDHDLRLITSTDLEGVAASEPGPSPDSASSPAETYYRLAHDYLIRPVRQWLERKQRSTRAGRARLRLEAITAAWLERPGRRQLPSPLECLGIFWHTRPGGWSVDERRLMRATARHYLTRAAATVVVVAALASGVKAWWDREQVRSKLAQAFTAKDRDLPELITELSPQRGLVIADLEAIENDPDALDHRREVATVLLYRLAPTAKRSEYLRERLLAATEADRLELIRSTLAASPGHAPGEAFWEVLLSRVASPQRRLRAAAALARLEPTHSHWSAGGPIVAAALLNEDRRAIPRWIELLEPVLPSIAPSLGRFFRNNQLDSATRSAASEAIAETLGRLRDGPALAALAADPGSESLRALVQEFRRLDQPVQALGSVLAAMTADADPEAFRVIIRELDRLGRPASAVEALEKVLGEPRPSDPSARERAVHCQVNAALALLVLGRLDRIPPLLSHSDAPRLRALLIDQFGQVKGQIQPLLDYLQVARGGDPAVLQAVLLAVAEIKSRTEENRARIETGIDRDPFTSSDIEKLVDSAADLYRNQSHPGVHSAAELVLRRWGREQMLAQCDEQSRSIPRPHDGPGWELGPQGHTLALLPGPLEFWMGSPDQEEGRFPHERRHYRRIDRSLAVATKEVTIAQYRAFKPDYVQDTRYTRELDCPVNTLNWYGGIL